MEPISEVRAAAEGLSALAADVDLVGGLETLAQIAAALVPSLVGVSLTVVVDGEPFTVTATDDRSGTVDALQYLGGGPCIDAVHDQQPLVVDDVLDERRWQLYSRAASATGVRASLSLPLADAAQRLPGAINLYAADPHAFTGKDRLLAEVFQTPAEEFTSNGDLDFMTREAARRLPEQLEHRAKVDQAVGMLVAVLGWPPDQARERLRAAASRAGTPIETVADVLVALNAV